MWWRSQSRTRPRKHDIIVIVGYSAGNHSSVAKALDKSSELSLRFYDTSSNVTLGVRLSSP